MLCYGIRVLWTLRIVWCPMMAVTINHPADQTRAHRECGADFCDISEIRVAFARAVLEKIVNDVLAKGSEISHVGKQVEVEDVRILNASRDASSVQPSNEQCCWSIV